MVNRAPLSDLPLRPSTLQLLQQRGFTNAKEFLETKSQGGITNLASELGTNPAKAAEIWSEVKSVVHSLRNDGRSIGTAAGASSGATVALPLCGPQSASALLRQYQQRDSSGRASSIVTFCRDVDKLLGGGISLGQLTEIAGAPGAGKTQWAMQAAVDAQLPAHWGGVQGETIYVDTEGSFSAERCFNMAQALVEHVKMGIQRRRRRQQEAGPNGSSSSSHSAAVHFPDWNTTAEEILNGIHVYRVHDEAAQTAVLWGAVPQLIAERQQAGSPVKLVVVDSMAFHYRAAGPNSDFMARTRQLTTTASRLTKLAATYQVAVLTVNQMTTKRTFHQGSAIHTLVPALGDSWSHAVSTRIILSGTGRQRICQLVKSPSLPRGTAHYQIVESGVRGMEYIQKEAPADRKRQRN